jgi:ABC-type microcin C transport system duplicated ATPase subunit YejF
MLERVQIPEADQRIGLYPFEFSGGMRQRAMIAMALLCQPELLIADEPTTALDVTVQAQILELLGELKRAGKTAFAVITHDLGVIAGLCDRVLGCSPRCRDWMKPRQPGSPRSRASRPTCSACQPAAPSMIAANT